MRNNRLSLQLLLHGAVVLQFGLLAGAPYNAALARGWGEEAVRGWALAHSAGIMCGLTAISVSSVMDRLTLSASRAVLMVSCLVASIYGFTFGMWLAPLCGVRGIIPWKSGADRLVHWGYLVGAWGSLVGGGVLVAGVWATLKAAQRGDRGARGVG